MNQTNHPKRHGGVWLGVLALSLCGAVAAAQQPPTRIVSLIPAVTEMLFAVGAGDQVVGVSTFDTYPEEVNSRTRVGGLFDPNVEAILALRPDLAIVYGSQDELVDRLQSTSIPIFSYRHAGLPDITQTIRSLGVRTGHAEAAEKLASRIEGDLESIRQAAATRPHPRTLLVFGREEGTMRELFVSGGIGFLHDMLEVAGGINVMADVKREGLQLSLEQLLARAPEVVIEVRASTPWSAARRAREMAAWQGVSIPAARSGHIRILHDDALTIPGPRVVSAVRKLAEALR